MTLSGRICECGHDLTYHRNEKDRHGKPRLVCVHFEGFTPCTCKNFKESSNSQTKLEGTMAKEKKVKAKSEGRKPTLAPYLNGAAAPAGPFKLYGKYKGKEYEAQVLSSGIIKMDDVEYTSPSSAACALRSNKGGKKSLIDGWNFWKYNKDGERVPLDAIRGAKSPLAIGGDGKLKKVKIAKVKAEKLKKVRKPRKSKVADTEPVEVQEMAATA